MFYSFFAKHFYKRFQNGFKMYLDNIPYNDRTETAALSDIRAI